MDRIEDFKKRIESLILRAYNGKPTLLGFLDLEEEAIVKDIARKNGMEIYFDGGIINAERKRALISLYDVSSDDFKIVIYKVNYNKKFKEINHRHVLGTLMSLGIKRECIGDIVITDNKDIYFACTKEIMDFIKLELHEINHIFVELGVEENKVENIIRYEGKIYFLASLRLDAVIASAYNISRSEASEAIFNGLVYVNHLVTQNSSHVLKVNDEISFRHKGRCMIADIGNTTKSGRIAVEIKKRV